MGTINSTELKSWRNGAIPCAFVVEEVKRWNMDQAGAYFAAASIPEGVEKLGDSGFSFEELLEVADDLNELKALGFGRVHAKMLKKDVERLVGGVSGHDVTEAVLFQQAEGGVEGTVAVNVQAAAAPRAQPQRLCAICGQYMDDSRHCGGVPTFHLARGTSQRPSVSQYIGNMQIIDAIKAGGMGEVWTAKEVSTDHVRALKTITFHGSDDKDTVKLLVCRFQLEATACAAFSHRNLLQFFDFRQDPETGIIFIALSLAPGESLEGQVLEEDELVHVLSETLEALQHMHDQGYIHRDLKPANIVFDRESRQVTLIDYGISKRITGASHEDDVVERSDLTATGMVIGTMAYIAPERFSSTALVDHRSDLFSMAVVAFVLATGSKPFHGDNLQVLRGIENDPFPEAAMAERVSEGVAGVCARAASKAPEERFESASEFRSALLAACGFSGQAGANSSADGVGVEAVENSVAQEESKGGGVEADETSVAQEESKGGGVVADENSVAQEDSEGGGVEAVESSVAQEDSEGGGVEADENLVAQEDSEGGGVEADENSVAQEDSEGAEMPESALMFVSAAEAWGLLERLKVERSGNVETLWCRSVDIEPDFAEQLAGCFAAGSCRNLVQLFFDGNQIGDQGAVAIGQQLGNLTALQELYLSGNRIGDQGAVAIGEHMGSLTALQELNLSINQIGDQGAVAIGEQLGNLTGLHKLYLYNNQIGDAGAVAIGQQLGNLTALQELHLNDNQIGDAGAVGIGQQMGNLTALRRLYLSGNQIGDEGAVAIGQQLGNLTALQWLSLDDNQFGDEGAVAIGQQMGNLTALTELRLPGGVSLVAARAMKSSVGDQLHIVLG